MNYLLHFISIISLALLIESCASRHRARTIKAKAVKILSVAPHEDKADNVMQIASVCRNIITSCCITKLHNEREKK